MRIAERLAVAVLLVIYFGVAPPAWSADSVQLIEFTVEPAAVGEQLVRVSLPFAAGALPADRRVLVRDGSTEIQASLRPLTWHRTDGKNSSVRRGLVTFAYPFRNQHPIQFALHSDPTEPIGAGKLPVEIRASDDHWIIAYRSGLTLRARPIWPQLEGATEWKHESVELSRHFLWERWQRERDRWAQVVELRVDAVGQVVLVAHLQRRDVEEDWLPEFGWEIAASTSPPPKIRETVAGGSESGDWTRRHSFDSGQPFAFRFGAPPYQIYHSAAPGQRCGAVYTQTGPHDVLRYRYLRSGEHDRVPIQRFAWRTAEAVVGPANVASLTPTLTSPHTVRVAWKDWDALYDTGQPLVLKRIPELASLYEFYRDAVLASVAAGPDWGNITTYDPTLTHGGVSGMNRLNHCPAIFFEAMRGGDQRLSQAALAWCNNFHDHTIWWGPRGIGGTRYPDIRRSHETPPDDDKSFLWRSDSAVHFCTKGFDSFLLAYEETGDPRMKLALDAQVAYAAEHVHANTGEARNIGAVADFMHLYEFTGEQRYLDQGARLFRELRSKLSSNNLFSQSGKPIVDDLPFIDDDETGYKHPFAKPYILGYALAGCPALARQVPDEPQLAPMIRAVADFLVESQDPAGGWRYPHPQSSHLELAIALEHAWQLTQAGHVLGARESDLDAIERVLRQRLWTWRASGQVLKHVQGWEASTGRIDDPQKIYQLYQRPAVRDETRDYVEGELSFEPCDPESLVYFPDVLRFYLQHRPASRLIEPPQEGSPLHTIVARLSTRPMLQTVGVRGGLPVFYERLARRMSFPLAWDASAGRSFEAWKSMARKRVRDCWLAALPDAPYDAETIASRARDGYQSHKIAVNLSGDSRVLAYLLVPEGQGPFPAVLLLHDHGAEFRIGKEKVVEPWDDRPARVQLAHDWVDELYGGRFLGVELARRGYVCLAIDALNWSDRGGAGRDGQQQLASNLLHLGGSLAGLIAHEDLRAAAFLAQRSEVDRQRIAAVGLSMGGFRAWQVAAMSPDVSAGVSVCWMATVKGLMVPGNNQAKGQSAFTMTHPGLFNDLDYPDVASLACPKPMLFYSGRQDPLFPVASVEVAHHKLRDVWKSQGVDDRLVTKLWDVPHVFNRDMQDEAFDWLDHQLNNLRQIP